MVLHFAKSIPDVFRPDGATAKGQAYLSLNRFCVISSSRSELRLSVAAILGARQTPESTGFQCLTKPLRKEASLRKKQLPSSFQPVFPPKKCSFSIGVNMEGIEGSLPCVTSQWYLQHSQHALGLIDVGLLYRS